jgi:putative ABC transport system ATP-binding protein
MGNSEETGKPVGGRAGVLSGMTRETAPDPHLVVDVEKVVKIYRSASAEFRAVDGIDLRARRGEFVAVVGRSGSGKSTLMNLIAGLDRPTSGHLRIAGTDLDGLTENQLAAWRGRAVGVVFQFFQLLPSLTVAENVVLPMELSRTVAVRHRRDRALAMLDRVGLRTHADKLPATLSGGEQQRAAIARALVNDPPVLVADEPTGNLDTHTGDAVLDLLGEVAAAGTCVLMVTHERDITRWVHRTVTLADGRVAA